jgi:hypothetical protein
MKPDAVTRFLTLFTAELGRRGIPHIARLKGHKTPFGTWSSWVVWRAPAGGWCAVTCHYYSMRPQVLRARISSLRVKNWRRFRAMLAELGAEERFEANGGEHSFLPRESPRIARWLAGWLLSSRRLNPYTWSRAGWAEYHARRAGGLRERPRWGVP